MMGHSSPSPPVKPSIWPRRPSRSMMFIQAFWLAVQLASTLMKASTV